MARQSSFNNLSNYIDAEFVIKLLVRGKNYLFILDWKNIKKLLMLT